MILHHSLLKLRPLLNNERAVTLYRLPGAADLQRLAVLNYETNSSRILDVMEHQTVYLEARMERLETVMECLRESMEGIKESTEGMKGSMGSMKKDVA
jgi:tRNA 2-selenouridine synthase SelU